MSKKNKTEFLSSQTVSYLTGEALIPTNLFDSDITEFKNPGFDFYWKFIHLLFLHENEYDKIMKAVEYQLGNFGTDNLKIINDLKIGKKTKNQLVSYAKSVFYNRLNGLISKNYEDLRDNDLKMDSVLPGNRSRMSHVLDGTICIFEKNDTFSSEIGRHFLLYIEEVFGIVNETHGDLSLPDFQKMATHFKYTQKINEKLDELRKKCFNKASLESITSMFTTEEIVCPHSFDHYIEKFLNEEIILNYKRNLTKAEKINALFRQPKIQLPTQETLNKLMIGYKLGKI